MVDCDGDAQIISSNIRFKSESKIDYVEMPRSIQNVEQ